MIAYLTLTAQKINSRMNIALFSINKHVYSETFIAAHKTLLNGNVFYYYGNNIANMKLENSDFDIRDYTLKQMILSRLSKSYKNRINRANLLSNNLKANKIDVALVEYGTLAFNLLPLFRIWNIPFIVHFHGYDASVKNVIAGCNNYKEVFERASAVIAVSKTMELALLDMGCPKGKLYYNTYGPNDLFLKVESDKSELLLVGIGRFVDKKAPYFTILAFSKILESFPKTKLILAGDGPLLNTSKNLVEYLGIENSVSFPGSVTPDHFRELLSKCRAFVQHSITSAEGDMEGTPVAILEAQAASIPVISTYHAGIQDVVENDLTGLLVKEKDVEGMANAMFKLLSSKNLADDMGNKARQNILANFTMSRHIRVLNEILQNLTKK
ncbi:glycosyltransferase [Mariniflexile sp. AS56]|uniref:glycosyltransferase n=1 Tax=Mariniflexile sp. AS56 TaxID=3063957 RepID=UPI0026EC6450|nr:glycosyltransferase [Mariniflexile sp. AS56]MDO7172735.1 glycosyltransferase [Mariniflexile sp. AS56]